ncbi:MAG: hypothetical protein Q4A27_02710 [bacterium]|nr:hypothetical protein [bacterium]
MSFFGIFDGKDAKIVEGNNDDSTRVDIYYGGQGEPDGPDHGHAVVKDSSLDYLREPGESKDSPSYDSNSGAMNWGDSGKDKK